MRPLDGCPIPVAQFASLSILLRCRLDVDKNDDDDDDDDDDDGEADEAAGPRSSSRRPSSLPRYVVAEERMVSLSPLATLPEMACRGCVDGLHRLVVAGGMLGRGMTTTIDDDVDDDIDDDASDDVGGGGPIPPGGDAVVGGGGGGARVTFHDDAKGGASTSASSYPRDDGDDRPSYAVSAYRPSRRDVGCASGMTLFYVAVRTGGTDRDDGDGDGDGDAPTTTTTTRALLDNCASALLPGISPGSLLDGRRRGDGDDDDDDDGVVGVVLLAVGVHGPAYDLYGGSPIPSALPARLRECMTTLASVDARRMMPPPSSLSSSSPPPPRDGANSETYPDPSNLRRLYAALLASLMDDDDGLMRDHDEIGTSSISATPSATDASGNRGVVVAGGGGGGVRKNKLFTFSRGGRGSSSGYASSGVIPSGGDDPPDSSGTSSGGRGRPSGASNAEIVRRTAQRLELISIVDDEMALPKYSNAGGGGGSGWGATPASPSTPAGMRSPRRSKAGGHVGGMGGSAPTGRFGRPPAPSDLSGFEYRPPSRRHRRGPHGGSSMSGATASASMMGSDDVSVATGGDDATAVTVGSRYTTSSSSASSSVPTLSKSTRDSSSAASAKSSRSRFLQRKRRDKGEGATMQQATDKPPLFSPHPRPHPQPAYDPFSMDDNFDDYEGNDKIVGGDDVYSSPTAQVMEAIGRRLSEEEEEGEEEEEEDEESARALQSIPKSAPSTPKEEHLTIMEPTENTVIGFSTNEEEETLAVVEPMGYLDVGLALNEDLTCEYHRSKLSSLSVEGTIQVSAKTRYEREPTPHQRQQPTAPFSLVFTDHSGHIKALQENKKFVEHVSQGGFANREFAYTIRVPREDEYFPVVRYKCGTSLRPVPIVSPPKRRAH
ncbi:hypothetical protein ACHAW5_006086 [Stephanodiscus triporus]|uniref:Uncharacterized protein n=1 Tax=Stephanodiscus triporus TaxID=2934178 RepID=A0ABD3QGP2_9STRA